MIETVAGIEYTKPEVYLLQESGLGVAEYAGRIAYNSFNKSENTAIQVMNNNLDELAAEPTAMNEVISNINEIEHSDLLDSLAHVYHHDSVLEHINLSYLVKGTSRGVLQEHARHRMQSITVQSTRYTMSPIINAFIAAAISSTPISDFRDLLSNIDFLVTTSKIYKEIEYDTIWNKLSHQYNVLGKDKFLQLAISKSSIEPLQIQCSNGTSPKTIYKLLQSGKQKRNVGDNFKHIVTDNWKVDLVFTMNLRALSNYLKLRDSGAAYFQIHWLAEAIIKATPQKYLNLISKKYQKD